MALLCCSDRLSSFLQQLLQELLQCLDGHKSLAPLQLLALLRLYIATTSRNKKENSSHLEREGNRKRNDCQSKTENNSIYTIGNAPENPKAQFGVCTELNSSKEFNFCQEGEAGVTDPLRFGPVTQFLLDYHEKQEETKSTRKREDEEALKVVDIELSKHSDDSNSGVHAFEQHVKDKAAQDLDEETSTKNIKRDDDPDDAPEEVKLIVNILERCCFLLHTRDRSVSLVLLDTIELGCVALMDWENNQLPVLHKVWKPLMLRIKDTDTIVTLRALTVCCVMVTCSGDFLRKRCLQDLLPVVNRFLVSQRTVSLNKTAASGYLMSAAYLTQKRLLEQLYPDLVIGLQVRSTSVDP